MQIDSLTKIDHTIQISIQLSKLGSVLNSLETGAKVGQRHIEQVAAQIRLGSYTVDPAQLSHRIVADSLGRA